MMTDEPNDLLTTTTQQQTPGTTQTEQTHNELKEEVEHFKKDIISRFIE